MNSGLQNPLDLTKFLLPSITTTLTTVKPWETETDKVDWNPTKRSVWILTFSLCWAELQKNITVGWVLNFRSRMLLRCTVIGNFLLCGMNISWFKKSLKKTRKFDATKISCVLESPGGGGYSLKIWVGVCLALTLFQGWPKIRYPISDLPKNCFHFSTDEKIKSSFF